MSYAPCRHCKSPNTMPGGYVDGVIVSNICLDCGVMTPVARADETWCECLDETSTVGPHHGQHCPFYRAAAHREPDPEVYHAR